MRFALERGRLALTMELLTQGRDLIVRVQGGAAHLGAVVTADRDGTVRLHSLPGHREGPWAEELAAELARARACTVCVCMGVHYDALRSEEIGELRRMLDSMTARCRNALAIAKETHHGECQGAG